MYCTHIRINKYKYTYIHIYIYIYIWVEYNIIPKAGHASCRVSVKAQAELTTKVVNPNPSTFSRSTYYEVFDT